MNKYDVDTSLKYSEKNYDFPNRSQTLDLSGTIWLFYSILWYLQDRLLWGPHNFYFLSINTVLHSTNTQINLFPECKIFCQLIHYVHTLPLTLQLW